jgi:2-polyprenyl-6-methoxyphenol hydroxylase-like FAD-dependent oxidoreductase
MATDTQVLVVGAGPAGLFMAAELNRHGVSCRIVDKNDGPTHDTQRLDGIDLDSHLRIPVG